MKRFLTSLLFVVASAAVPAFAQQGAAAPQQQHNTQAARSHAPGRFTLLVAGADQGVVNNVEEEAADESAPPALNGNASAQAQAAAPRVRLPAPSTVTPQQVQTDPRVPPNP